MPQSSEQFRTGRAVDDPIEHAGQAFGILDPDQQRIQTPRSVRAESPRRHAAHEIQFFLAGLLADLLAAPLKALLEALGLHLVQRRLQALFHHEAHFAVRFHVFRNVLDLQDTQIHPDLRRQLV